jgi:uncharacterized repeat protein (TIGR02543 family)
MRLKHFLSVFLTLLTLSVGQVWGTPSYSWTLASGDLGTTGSPTTSISSKGSPAINWSAEYTWGGSDATKYFGSDANKGVQIGTGNATNKCATLVLSTSGVSGTITDVTINTSGASSVNATVGVQVGNTNFKYNNAYTASLTNSNTAYSFTGNASGTITITWSNSSAKALYIKSITVTATNTQYNVVLSRNGATEVVNNVTGGTSLDNIDGTGNQGGCSAWTFVGWSKTQRAAQNNSTAMTLVTTVDGAGPYYAVYKHKESGASSDVDFNFGYTDWGKSSSFSGTDFDVVSQEDEGAGITITYTRNSGSLYANSNSLRFYKSNELTFDAGDQTITAISFTGSVGQTDITTDVSTCTNTSSSLSWEGEASSVTFTRPSNAASYATLTSATVTVESSTTYYSTTASCCSTLDPINGSVSAVQPEGCDKKKVEWTIPVDGSSEKKAAGVILKLYADDNNAKGSEITTKAADYSTDNTTTTHTFEGLDASTKYWFTITLIGTTASGVTYCNSAEGTAVPFETAAASSSWTITYNANGEGVTNLPADTYADKTSGEGTLSSTVPVRAGYTFLGWDKSSSATVATYAASGAITGVDANTELYAIWEQRTVILNAGSGTVSGSPLTPNAQGKVTLPSAAPSAACAEIGWAFVGWAEAAATGTKPATIIPAGEYTPAAKMTLYAVYGELGNTYTKITNAANFTTGNYVFATAAGKALNNELNSDNKAAGKNVTITSGTTISTTSSDADIIWQVTKSSNNYTLYNAAITKYLNIVPNTSDNFGHLGLEDDSRNYTVDMSNGDVRLWAPGKSSNQVIEYYNAFTCYGSVNNNALIYAFKQDYDSYATSPNCTAYTLNKVVDPADKGNIALGKTSLLPGAQTTAEATPIDGYRFLNWTITGAGATMSNTSEGKSTDNPVTVTMGSENATITAHFEEIPSHDVKFSVNGSVVAGLTLADQLEGTAIVFPDAAAITAASAFPETQKAFIGWTNEENKNYKHATVAPTLITSATVPTADVTYYAVFADVEVGTDYEKLTSTAGLKAGDKLVVTDGEGVGMMAYNGSANNCAATEITIANDKISVLGDACQLTLGGTAGHWTLFDGTYYIYDAGTNSNNHMKGKTEKDDACEWTITISGGTTTVQSVTNTAKPYMKYNSNSSIFSCYSSGQSDVTLFKKAITYSAYTTTISPLSSIAITTPATKTAYKKGETLDLTDLVVTATYEDASTRPVTNYSVTPSLTTPLTTDITSFTVTHSEGSVQNKTANQTINVYALTGLSVTTGPTKTEYNAGESFDPEGMIVAASWGNGAITNPNVTGYTYSTDPLTNGTDHNITVDVTITYTSAGDEVTTTQEVTVIPRPSLTMTWNVAGSTTTSEIFANAQDKYLLALPENNPNPVDAGFTSDFVFKGWTKATSVNKDGTSIVYAAANDEQTQAETFYAVFAQKNGEDIPAGYKLKDEAPAADETILITRLVSGTYYAMTTDQTPSSSALTITNGVVSSSTSSLAWTVADATDGVSLRASSNYLHMNSSALKVASGTDNSDIVFTSNSDGSYKATRADGTRWIVTSGTNGFGCSATEENAAALYIFKYSAASYATYSNYRLMPSSVKAPTGLAAGTYYCESKTITLAQEDSKAIYYTTNGDVPTNASTLYEGQFSVNASCTIKAVAYDADEQDYSTVVEAEYVIVSSIDAPTMPVSKTFYGTSESVEIEHALTTEGAVIHYSFDNVDYNDYSAALNITATTTVYAYATIGSLTSDKVSATYTKGESVTYKKVTSAAELVPGMKFIIVSQNSDTYYAAKAGTLGSSSNAKWMDDVTITAPEAGEVTIGGADIAVFELGGKSGEYTMTSQDGVLGSTAAKKLSYEGGTTTWDITFSELGAATISNTAEGIGTLLFNFNSGDPRFTTYASGTAVEIYMQKPGYERTVREGYYGTICLPNGGKMIGTTLYEIAYYDAGEEKIFFDEVLDGNMVAGMPYIFQPVEGAQKLYQYSNASHVDSPVPAADANGLVGNLGSTITLSAGDYFLYNNQYYVVSASETRTISVPQYYAYIDMSEVSHQPTSLQPGRRRIAMSVHGEQVATGMDELNASEAPVKVMIDGKFYILRGEKMYDATGKLVK